MSVYVGIALLFFKQISLKESAFIRVEMKEEIIYLDRVCVLFGPCLPF